MAFFLLTTGYSPLPISLPREKGYTAPTLFTGGEP